MSHSNEGQPHLTPDEKNGPIHPPRRASHRSGTRQFTPILMLFDTFSTISCALSTEYRFAGDLRAVKGLQAFYIVARAISGAKFHHPRHIM